jgi:hypothetical protein
MSTEVLVVSRRIFQRDYIKEQGHGCMHQGRQKSGWLVASVPKLNYCERQNAYESGQ